MPTFGLDESHAKHAAQPGSTAPACQTCSLVAVHYHDDDHLWLCTCRPAVRSWRRWCKRCGDLAEHSTPVNPQTCHKKSHRMLVHSSRCRLSVQLAGTSTTPATPCPAASCPSPQACAPSFCAGDREVPAPPEGGGGGGDARAAQEVHRWVAAWGWRASRVGGVFFEARVATRGCPAAD